jgi:phospholipid/cholesterol/gamma-HCH transport system ATP-binding protein
MLDEPTTGLDPARSHSVHELIRATQIKFGLTAVMVSHDVPQVFEISDRVAYMHTGKIAFSGTAAEVTTSANVDFQQFLAGSAAGEEERPLSQVIATPGR